MLALALFFQLGEQEGDMKKILALGLAVGGLAFCLTGCVRSEMYIMARQAEAKIAEAEKAGAATSATYEFEAAKSWLAFAKHENNESDGAGYDYSKKALDFANAALEKSKGGGK
jgi:hypothetical protein